MTSCSTNTCGVGGWSGPLPGDPGNDSILTAVPAFGGIDVSWVFPTTNPFAVAYTKLYRGTSADFSTAILLKEVAGTFWYDRVETAIRYYYWIRFVSVNEGGEGELIGPASAIAKPTIAGMLEYLTGQIDSGLLANELKTKVDYIGVLTSDLAAEVTDRETGETTLAQAIAAVQQGVADAHTFILNESNTRVGERDALVQQITGVAATSDSALVAATQLLQGQINAQGIAVSDLQTVYGQLDGEVAGVAQQMSVQIGRIDGVQSDVSATNNRINALYTVRLTVNDLVGGFGLANDGHIVEAGFDVDTFWVGRTQANKRKPFIISDGVVYIDEAAINKLTFSKLRDESGSFIVQDGKIKAEYLKVTYLDGATGSFSGSLSAATGTFSGSLSAGKIAVGVGGTKTTFFDPVSPAVALNSVAIGSFFYSNRLASPTVITDDGVKFKCLDGTWTEKLRIRSGSVVFQILANGAVEDLFSLWVRKNGGSWVCLRAVTETALGVGHAIISHQYADTAGLGDVYEFGISPTTSSLTWGSTGDYSAMFNASVNVTVVNF